MQLSTPRGARTTAEEALATWREYRATGDRRLRDRLVTMHLPLVRYIVYKKLRELPARYDVDDLTSAGVVGLITALDRYDPDKGAGLDQFLWTRIHGAVLDELRRDDPATRSLRRWDRQAAAVRRSFLSAHGREPSDEELAERLGMTADALRARRMELDGARFESLDAVMHTDEDGSIARGQTIVSTDATADPEAATHMTHAKERFREAFRALSAREREVAVLIYASDMTLKDIGTRFGVSESRICQIHGQLKRHLRTSLSADAGLFSELA